MDPAEIEFLAESSTVKIMPNFNEGVIHFLYGEGGPFRAGMTTIVPLWLATNLRSRRKCRFVHPDFLNLDKLEEVRDAEKEQEFFTEMPHPHLFVVAQLIMDVATPDLTDADRIKTLLKDIWDIRQAKLRKSVASFVQSGLPYAKLDHLQLIELNAVRPLMPLTMDHLLDMEGASEEANSKGKKASQNTTNSFLNSSY